MFTTRRNKTLKRHCHNCHNDVGADGKTLQERPDRIGGSPPPKICYECDTCSECGFKSCTDWCNAF